MTPQIYPCQGTDPEVFFDPEMVEQAKAICAGCWFRTECLRQAKARGEEYGVWGGVLFEPHLSERDKAILAMVREGLSQTKIATAVGLRRSTVANIIADKAPELQKMAKPSRRDDVLELWDDGLHPHEIAERLGVHRATVQAWLRKERHAEYFGYTKEAA